MTPGGVAALRGVSAEFKLAKNVSDAQRRKALRGVLRSVAPADAVDAALAAAGVDPLARGESLTVEDFVRIAEALPPTSGQPSRQSSGRPSRQQSGPVPEERA